MNTKLCFLFAMLTSLSQAKSPRIPVLVAGQETRNGGNTIYNPEQKTLVLADEQYLPHLHSYRAIDEETYTILRDLEYNLETVLKLSLVNDADLNLFRDLLLSENAHYKFVDQLPAHCRFVEAKELSLKESDVVVQTGCTIDGITYLVPGPYFTLSPQRRALFLIHERLHVFAPHIDLPIKADFVAALKLLQSRYFPAYWEHNLRPNPKFKLSPEELTKLNTLTNRLRRLKFVDFENSFDTDLVFTAAGGTLRNQNVPARHFEQWSIAGDASIDLGSFIEVRNSARATYRLKPKFTSHNLVMHNSVISVENIESLLVSDTVLENVRVFGEAPASPTDETAPLTHLTFFNIQIKNASISIPHDYQFVTLGTFSSTKKVDTSLSFEKPIRHLILPNHNCKLFSYPALDKAF